MRACSFRLIAYLPSASYSCSLVWLSTVAPLRSSLIGGDQLLFGRSGILQQPARLAAFGQYAEQQMLDRSVLVAERLREVARFWIASELSREK